MALEGCRWGLDLHFPYNPKLQLSGGAHGARVEGVGWRGLGEWQQEEVVLLTLTDPGLDTH